MRKPELLPRPFWTQKIFPTDIFSKRLCSSKRLSNTELELAESRKRGRISIWDLIQPGVPDAPFPLLSLVPPLQNRPSGNCFKRPWEREMGCTRPSTYNKTWPQAGAHKTLATGLLQSLASGMTCSLGDVPVSTLSDADSDLSRRYMDDHRKGDPCRALDLPSGTWGRRQVRKGIQLVADATAQPAPLNRPQKRKLIFGRELTDLTLGLFSPKGTVCKHMLSRSVKMQHQFCHGLTWTRRCYTFLWGQDQWPQTP